MDTALSRFRLRLPTALLASAVVSAAFGTAVFAQPAGTDAASRPLEGLLIVASADEGPFPGDARTKLSKMTATMAHLDKNQFNAINFIPKGQAPTMFVPVASPLGRTFLFTYDEKQADPMKRNEFRISFPFQALSYQLSPPFLRSGSPADFSLRNLTITAGIRTVGSNRWSWSPDGKRLYFSLGKEQFICSDGGARQITFTDKSSDLYLQGFAHDSNHVLFATSAFGGKTRYYVAKLPEAEKNVSLTELSRAATQVALGVDYTGVTPESNFYYSPDGKSVAFAAQSKTSPNSMELFAGAHDQPRRVHTAVGIRNSLDTGEGPGTVLGQDTIAGAPIAGKPYVVKFARVMIMGWSQDGRTLYFYQSEKSGKGIAESNNRDDHKVRETNQIWAWTADRGAAKLMDIPVLSFDADVGCRISHDARWTFLWGLDLPGDEMTAAEHTDRTVTRSFEQHLYVVDLKNRSFRKIQRRSSNFDYATFTKPERWEGEVFPGFNENTRGEELPDNYVRFGSPVSVKPWQHQWAFELNFEGNVHDFARRRDGLYVEATFYRPDGSPYLDTDKDFGNGDGAAASSLPFNTAQLRVDADAFRGTYYVPFTDVELLAASQHEVDVVLRLFEGTKMLGQTKPASRVTITEAESPRVWFKNVKVGAAEENGQPGIVVTADAATQKLSSWDVHFDAVIRDANLNAVAARSVAYRGPDQTAVVRMTHRPRRDDETVPLRMFLPLAELQLNSGAATLHVQLQGRVQNNFVGGSRQTGLDVRIP